MKLIIDTTAKTLTHKAMDNVVLLISTGIMRDLYDVPRGAPEWIWDNPVAAVEACVQSHPDFIQAQPAWAFNETNLTNNSTHWPGAWLRKRDGG